MIAFCVIIFTNQFQERRDMSNLTFGNLMLGYLDAENEVRYNRESFEDFFYDLNGTLNKLSDFKKPTSLLIGRKGVGKSAYAVRLDLLNIASKESFIVKLGEVSYGHFVKISDNKGNVLGTQRYLHAWYLLLLCSVVKRLDEKDVTDVKALKVLKNAVSDLGLSSGRDIVRDIFIASKKEFKVKLSMLELSLSSDGDNTCTKFSNLTDFTNFFIDVFCSLGITREIFPIIDGVDDILRTKKDTQEILSGLVRAVYSLNQKNFSNNKVKFILVIREDIVKMINDPDMNKIVRDTGYKLDWYTNSNSGTDNLLMLLNKRILFKEQEYDNSNPLKIWNTLFPNVLKNQSSWNYFLEYTMYRPRDIIQFLNQFIENYPNHNNITREVFNDELRKFSQDYFYEEMRNELLGFLNDDTIDALFDVLQKLGTSRRDNFDFQDILDVYSENYPNYDIKEVKHILTTLFNTGYVGMLRKIEQGNHVKTYVNFKHKDPRLAVDFSSKFIIHKGLFSALNI